MEWNNGNYDRWRKRRAWRNIIIIIIIMILTVWLFGYLSELNVNSKQKTEDLKQKFSTAVKTYNEKNIPLKTDIITKCISGKKAIIVNGEIYYAGDPDTWGDIKGIDCGD